jgi:hypothetical protein
VEHTNLLKSNVCKLLKQILSTNVMSIIAKRGNILNFVLPQQQSANLWPHMDIASILCGSWGLDICWKILIHEAKSGQQYTKTYCTLKNYMLSYKRRKDCSRLCEALLIAVVEKVWSTKAQRDTRCHPLCVSLYKACTRRGNKFIWIN